MLKRLDGALLRGYVRAELIKRSLPLVVLVALLLVAAVACTKKKK